MPAANTIPLTVNGEERAFAAGAVGDLLKILNLPPASVVVELNGTILPGEGKESVPLNAGDRVEIIHFVGGG